LINKKGAREAGCIKVRESRGGNQVDEKRGKTNTIRSSTGKKEGRKASVLWCLRKSEV
jgi:hypothetical protein